MLASGQSHAFLIFTPFFQSKKQKLMNQLEEKSKMTTDAETSKGELKRLIAIMQQELATEKVCVSVDIEASIFVWDPVCRCVIIGTIFIIIGRT